MLLRHPLPNNNTGMPNPQSGLSVETTSQPCAASRVDIAAAPHQGSRMGPREQICRSYTSVTQLGVA